MAAISKTPMVLSFFFSASFLIIPAVLSLNPLIGVHPLDEKYFVSELIKCKDGSKLFGKDRVNDNFCDCVDGTDEPGTSACPMGKFYCRNVGSTPRFLFSSRVNDQICDCCDGTDEYDGKVHCPNTCTKGKLSLEDLIQKLKGLKVVLILQVILVLIMMALWLFQRRLRRKRRRYH